MTMMNGERMREKLQEHLRRIQVQEEQAQLPQSEVVQLEVSDDQPRKE